MRLIYCRDDTPISPPRPVAVGEIARTVSRSAPVTACAVIGSGAFVIEATTDHWRTISWAAPVTATPAGVIVPLSPEDAPSGPSLWRLRALSAGLAGVFYPGVGGEITDPSAPSALETRVLSVDTEGTSGLTVCQISGQQAAGAYSWEAIPADEITATLRPWHQASAGGRLPWVIEDPLGERLALVRSFCQDFPFTPLSREWWSGGFDVRGVPE